MEAIDIIVRGSYLWKNQKVMITRIIDPGFKAVSKGKILTVYAEDLQLLKILKRR